jgi:acetyltransferase-like isoleucine patch superfamily enzyme
MESLTRMDPRAFWDTLCELMSAHASDVLPRVTVPTLVIAASHDMLVPRAQIEALATGLRGPHRTVIEDNAFIGCNSNLVAPVTVGSGAYVGAGSTITKNVPADALGVARARQTNIEEWVKRQR